MQISLYFGLKLCISFQSEVSRLQPYNRETVFKHSWSQVALYSYSQIDVGLNGEVPSSNVSIKKHCRSYCTFSHRHSHPLQSFSSDFYIGKQVKKPLHRSISSTSHYSFTSPSDQNNPTIWKLAYT